MTVRSDCSPQPTVGEIFFEVSRDRVHFGQSAAYDDKPIAKAIGLLLFMRLRNDEEISRG